MLKNVSIRKSKSIMYYFKLMEPQNRKNAVKLAIRSAIKNNIDIRKYYKKSVLKFESSIDFANENIDLGNGLMSISFGEGETDVIEYINLKKKKYTYPVIIQSCLYFYYFEILHPEIMPEMSTNSIDIIQIIDSIIWMHKKSIAGNAEYTQKLEDIVKIIDK